MFLFVFIFSTLSFSQSDLFIARNVLKAYDNGTRSFDGKPGKNYWQNSADYKIKVSVEPKTRLVKGSEKIVYHNNSPDTLDQIIFNIIQDLNKPETERNVSISKDALTDGVDIEKLIVNNIEIDPKDNDLVRRRNTLMTVFLYEPLMPDSQITFDIDWNFTIPWGETNPRMGAYDSTSYFVGYWYPQIAVYDDIDGWDFLAHNGEQEFYNDFSNYDVEITVPNTFPVWATGVLQNPEEVLMPEYLKRYNEAHTSDSVVNIITKDDINSGEIYKKDSELNTWKYKVNNITDFAFAMSDHYLWDGVSTIVDKDSGRRAYIAAVYPEKAKDFYKVDDITRKAVDYYSSTLPGVPFPYPSLTVFNGLKGGMEFPMMINEESSLTRWRTVEVTTHETAHQYFPFYTGINEIKYSFMEEGMAQFLPLDIQAELGKYDPLYRMLKAYESFAGDEMEMPMMIPNYQLRGWAREISIYFRPGLAYHFLRDALGKELFAKCMHEYIKRWHGKHPIPYDFFFTFNEVAGKDLSWYWKPWFFERGYPDLGIKNASYDNGKLEIEIAKVGIIPIPVELTITCEDSSVIKIDKTAEVWENGDSAITIDKETNEKPISIILGSDSIPDSEKQNNYFYFSGN
jgi:Peptidase family M1 domain